MYKKYLARVILFLILLLLSIATVQMNIRAKRVIIIVTDGAGSLPDDKSSIPALNQFTSTGVYCPNSGIVLLSLTAPNVMSIVTGVLPEFHGYKTNGIMEESDGYKNSKYPTVFYTVKSHFPKANIGIFISWEPLVNIIEDIPHHSFQHTDDYYVAEEAIKYIKKHKEDKEELLLFLHFSGVDSTGHLKTKEEYPKALGHVDYNIKRILSTIKRCSLWKDSLIIITADHGLSPYRHVHPYRGNNYTFNLKMDHGKRNDKQETTVFWAANGYGVRQKILKNYSVRNFDTAGTVLYAFGLQIPSYYNSTVVKVFE